VTLRYVKEGVFGVTPDEKALLPFSTLPSFPAELIEEPRIYTGVTVELVWVEFGIRPWRIHVILSQGITLELPARLDLYKEFKHYHATGQTLTIEFGGGNGP